MVVAEERAERRLPGLFLPSIREEAENAGFAVSRWKAPPTMRRLTNPSQIECPRLRPHSTSVTARTAALLMRIFPAISQDLHTVLSQLTIRPSLF